MSIDPGTQNIENLGNSAETLRLIFRALDLKISAHDSFGKTSLFEPRPRFAQSHSSCLQLPLRPCDQTPPRASYVEQSWNNVRAKTLSFTAFLSKHCSIDFELFLCAPSAVHLLAMSSSPNAASRAPRVRT